MTARRTLAALWTLAVLVACSIPGDALRSFAILTPDKLYHALAFIGFALVWRWAGVRPLAVLVSGIAFAVFIEVWQATLPIGRFADPYDTLADIVGLLFGLWTARVAQKAWDERQQRTAG
ncbi:MAG TPA: VanZ family protein [Bacteroidetes bacterium]|nr:VanZ family protein [Bacteroidota bacterium]